jgi:hypothetical protein
MSDFQLVDPQGWSIDLHSVQSNTTSLQSTQFILMLFSRVVMTGIHRLYGIFSDPNRAMVRDMIIL